jgi:small subunit ribosomal protein S5
MFVGWLFFFFSLFFCPGVLSFFLFLHNTEYLEVQRRRRRALRDDSEYKGPITRDVLMKAKMPGELWHPRLIQYSQSSVTRKGGRVNSFRALIVLGNGQGSAGFGFGKGVNMRFAIEDATMKAYRDVVSIPLYENRTLHHDCLGKYNNVKVQMRSARPGYGLKAGPVMNAICDCFGIRDCVTRVHGGSNRYTVVHAAFKSFENYRSVEQAALARGQRLVDVNDLMEEHYANDLYHKWGKLDGVSEYRKSKKKNQTKF